MKFPDIQHNIWVASFNSDNTNALTDLKHKMLLVSAGMVGIGAGIAVGALTSHVFTGIAVGCVSGYAFHLASPLVLGSIATLARAAFEMLRIPQRALQGVDKVLIHNHIQKHQATPAEQPSTAQKAFNTQSYLARRMGEVLLEELTLNKRVDAETCLNLITSGADLNRRDKEGNTALILAACYDHTAAVVKALLAHGADINAQNKKGETALDICNKFSVNKKTHKALEVGAKAAITQKFQELSKAGTSRKRKIRRRPPTAGAQI